MPFLSPLRGENIEMHTAMSGASMGDLQSLLESFGLEEDCAGANGLLKGEFPYVHDCWVNLLFPALRGLE